MRSWRWIVIGLAVVAFAALVFPLVLTQNRLRETHSELVQARKAITELEWLFGFKDRTRYSQQST